jgi:methylation protein EvaC
MVDAHGMVRCAFCEKETLVPFMDFGEVALAGGFLKESAFSEEKKHPLVIAFCTTCYAVQVERTVDPEILFRDYFYFSSAIGTLREHFARYATEVVGRFLPDPAKGTVVEIGCNDGVLLRPLADEGVGKVIGVDPAKNVVETINDPRITVVNDFFGTRVASHVGATHGKADLVCANNMFAHLEEINDVTKGVADLLSDEGVFIFEVHYLGSILEELQYDMMYHEHLYYYSILALDIHLARHGLAIFDVAKIPIHGGSIRVYAAKQGSARVQEETDAVREFRGREKARGYDTLVAYEKFAAACARNREKIRDTVHAVLKEGGKIAGYGASGRANTVLQYCGLTTNDLAYIVDDAPAKQGFFTPGTHIPIKARTILEEDPPTHLLLFAWAFYDEIRKKNDAYIAQGGKFILPLPDVRVE